MGTRAKLNLSSVGTAAENGPAEARMDRRGKRIISGHFPIETWAALRKLAVDLDKTGQELLEEALTDLLAKYRGN